MAFIQALSWGTWQRAEVGCIDGMGFVLPTRVPALAPIASPVPLTGAAELILLDLSHIEAAELGWSGALGEEPDGGALAQPLREPGQVAVAEEVVGVQAAAGRQGSQQPQDGSCPPHCPPAAPAWLIPKAGGIQSGTRRSPTASVPVAKATLLGSAWGCSAGLSPPSPPHGAVPALLSCLAGTGSRTGDIPLQPRQSFPPQHSQCPQLGHVVEAGHGDGSDIVVIQGPAKRQRGAGQGGQAINGSVRWSRWHQTPRSNSTHPPRHRVDGWRGEGWGQPKPPGKACCPFQAFPLHSQLQPCGPPGAGSGPGAQLCSSGTRPLLSLSSGPGRDSTMGMSLQRLSEWGAPRETLTPRGACRLEAPAGPWPLTGPPAPAGHGKPHPRCS